MAEARRAKITLEVESVVDRAMGGDELLSLTLGLEALHLSLSSSFLSSFPSSFSATALSRRSASGHPAPHMLVSWRSKWALA